MTPDERAQLRKLLASDDWKPVQAMLEQWNRDKLQICGTAKDRHEFWQGYWRGVVQFELDLREAAKEKETPLQEATSQFERAANGRNADGGAY